MASMTPGRKLNTGIDCSVSSKGIKTRSALALYAARYPYAMLNTRLMA